MHMTKFNQHTGIVLPLDIANIDTDNIIPKQFLKEIHRSNFGKYLFFNWRFLEKTTFIPNKNFILNYPYYKNASILLTRRNFGCGSSREHAVWALIDYGFRVIIAPSFADIFYKNSFNNHLLLAIVKESSIDCLFKKIQTQKQEKSVTVNLYDKQIYTKDKKYPFKINDIYRNYLLYDLDRISLTLKNHTIIQEYENKQLDFLK